MRALKKNIVFIVIAATIYYTCKKEHLQQETVVNGTPLFYFSGTVNNAYFNIQAGTNNYYMYSSYAVDSNNLLNFTGTLAPIGCNSCGGSIKIAINDYKVESNASAASLDTGSYIYLAPTGGVSTSYSVTFTPGIGAGTPKTYAYKFGDGSLYLGSAGSQTHIYSHPGIYTPALAVTFSDNAVDSIKTTTSQGGPVPAFTNALTVYSSNPSNNDITFLDSINGSSGPYSVLWNFGDGQTANSNYITGLDTMTHHYTLPGEYNAFAKVTDINNAVVYSYIHCTAKDSPSYSPPDYILNLTLGSSPIANLKAFSNINITYTDATGNAYTSAKAIQPLSSYFQILSASNYQFNENNQGH